MSTTERFQPIYDIAAICAKKNLKNVVLCPGSRNAPLALAFIRHPDLVTKTFSDERSAGFIAIGLAQQSSSPSILLTTSGTAAYNLAPAIAEAYFGLIPLVVFTADRPTEWIGQQDGQTIFQYEIFGRHVKKSFQLPQDYDHDDAKWGLNRIVNEAINLSKQNPPGPVHVNIPFREPLYPQDNTPITYNDSPRIIEDHTPGPTLTAADKELISDIWPTFHNVLIVSGQQPADPTLVEALTTFFSYHNIPIVGEVISNMHPIAKVVRHADIFLGEARPDIKKTLRPDLLITFGGPLVSKHLKLFLREYPPHTHWHIQPDGAVADTFKSVSDIFHSPPTEFFDFLSSITRQENFESQKQNNFNKFWEVEERRAARTMETFFPQEELAEFELVKEVMNNLPSPCNLHLANSMSVRYANFVGLSSEQSGVIVYSNRGTSGIDGCTSTAIGHALENTGPNILITGDLAFFYDRNAFWHNYAIPNLRIVVLNNHGGVIFKMLDGPAQLPESDEYFVTRQSLHARKLCEEFGFEYLNLDNRRKLKNLMKDFFDFDGRTKILELQSDAQINKTVFDKMKQKMKGSYEA